MRRSALLCGNCLKTFSPWKSRPAGLNLNGRPQLVNPSFFRTRYKHRNPDDSTTLQKLSHVFLKRCPQCKRSRFVNISRVNDFHTCCEGVEMKVYGTMQTVINAEQKILTASRQWNSRDEKPWCNPHRPKPKGRSKLKKQ